MSASGNGTKAYRCMFCKSVVTYSDQAIYILGNKVHSFTNPTGMRCDFYTFSSCLGAIAVGDATVEHTWFLGYRWSLALCQHCGSHLGWYYEGTSDPRTFWGILIYHLLTA
jgi:hypothetical protein